MPNNFARAKGLGKWGEKQVINHLMSKPGTIMVNDVAEDKEWQNKGIDIVVTDKTGEWTADVKLDRMIARTGNLFIEIMSSDKTMGNMVTSSADYFLYLDPFNCKLFTINRQKLFDFWHDNQKDIVTKEVGKSERKTKGFLITVELIQEIGLAIVEDIYVDGARKNKI